MSPDVWPASDPEPGLGRKAEEGGQQRLGSPWVGSAHFWASLMGRQPSDQAGMSVCGRAAARTHVGGGWGWWWWGAGGLECI